MLHTGLVLLAVAFCGVSVQAQDAAKDPIIYLGSDCVGRHKVIVPNNKCTPVPNDLPFVGGVSVPEGAVCDFYSDHECFDPLYIGVEAPGECNFDSIGVSSQSRGVVCYLEDA